MKGLVGGLIAVAVLAACGGGEDTQAARLQELEQRLQVQQQRQDELEAVVKKALDGTSQQVGRLLEQLMELGRGGALGPGDVGTGMVGDSRPADAASPTNTERGTGAPPAAEPAAVGPTGDARGAAAPAGAAEERLSDAERAARAEQQLGELQLAHSRTQQAWLIAVLTVGLGAIGFLAWRLLRARRVGGEARPVAASGEMTTDELWAAAGLLSEAVGRLRGAVPEVAAHRATTPPAPPRGAVPPLPPAAPARAVGDGLHLGPDDLFVLDDEDALLRDVDFGAAPEVPAPAAPTPAAGNGAPRAAAEPAREPAGTTDAPWWSVHLQARDPARALATIDAYLRQDPRVLRRPAPVVRQSGPNVLVECALLPGLLPGEAEHLRSTMQRMLASL